MSHDQRDIDALANAAQALIGILRSDWESIYPPPYDGQAQANAQQWADTLSAAVERVTGEREGEDY